MNAKPNLNGNTHSDFVQAGEQLYTIAREARDGIRSAVCDVLNGRNYQHYPQQEAQSARAADLARIKAVHDALDTLQAIALELAE